MTDDPFGKVVYVSRRAKVLGIIAAAFVSIVSAGSVADKYLPAHRLMVYVAEKNAMDYTDKKAQPLNRAILDTQRLITNGTRNQLRSDKNNLEQRLRSMPDGPEKLNALRELDKLTDELEETEKERDRIRTQLDLIK